MIGHAQREETVRRVQGSPRNMSGNGSTLLTSPPAPLRMDDGIQRRLTPFHFSPPRARYVCRVTDRRSLPPLRSGGGSSSVPHFPRRALRSRAAPAGGAAGLRRSIGQTRDRGLVSLRRLRRRPLRRRPRCCFPRCACSLEARDTLPAKGCLTDHWSMLHTKRKPIGARVASICF